jgi:SAM-dependent methyltransferase
MGIQLTTEVDTGIEAGVATGADAPSVDLAGAEAFAAQVAGHQAAAYNAVLTYLGDRLGLWRALASVDAATSAELAARSGLAERYVREWLAAQATHGYVTYDPATQAFTLPDEHALVLADEDSPFWNAAAFEIIAAVWAGTDRLAHAYATGEGIAWGEHDARLFTGVDRFYHAFYRQSLVQQWLPAIDGLVERLERGIRVVDVGAGLGSATVLLAQAFPASTFLGVDSHEESVRRATEAAERAGVSDRVQFVVGDAAGYAGDFDLVCFFDSLHDLGDPVGALVHARSRLAAGGQVFCVEPFAEDRLEDNIANPVAAVFYPGSSCLCVPHGVSEGGPALGAQAGPSRLTRLFSEAGFGFAGVAVATPANLVIEARV